MMQADMYQANILDHYKNPHNKGAVARPDIKHVGNNPLCGDELEITMKLQGEKIKDVKFKGKGCAISQAVASMLTDSIKGRPIEEVAALEGGDVIKLLGIPISATRMRCAMLALVTIKDGIGAHEGNRIVKTTTEDVPGEGA